MVSEQRFPFRNGPVSVLLICLLLTATGIIYAVAAYSGSATVETQATDRNADDPALWIHPTDPSLSVLLGTFKTKGLALYSLDGSELHFVDQYGGLNNVDLRYNFPLDGEHVDLIVGTDRNPGRNTLVIYKMNPVTRLPHNVTADPPVFSAFSEVYGTCMYVSPVSGNYYAFITSKLGRVEQWQLFDDGSGKVDGKLVRGFDVGLVTEGCVADDVNANFYVGEEDVGIWKYGAEPGDGETRTAVDFTATGHLTADVEGLSIYYTNDNRGYLLASSQGASEYVVYERLGGNAYITTFDIVAGNGIDETTSSDGIDVTNASLGPTFPLGVFIAHDGTDDVGSSNFKLLPWQDIAGGAEPDLKIDTIWDPRLVGLPPLVDFTAVNRSGPAPLLVQFSEQALGVRSSWLWDFGDGHSSSEANPSHTYTVEGEYTVKLTVTNAFGSVETSKTGYIKVGSQLNPAADFAADVTSGDALLKVTFSNLSAGDIDSCLWALGDGTTYGDCANHAHMYVAAGTYTVSLTVTNSYGSDEEIKNDYIVVDDPPKPADLLYLPLLRGNP